MLAWLLKISTPKLLPDQPKTDVVFSVSEAVRNAALGPLPGWSVVTAVAVLYAAILYAAIRREPDEGEFAHGEVHV